MSAATGNGTVTISIAVVKTCLRLNRCAASCYSGIGLDAAHGKHVSGPAKQQLCRVIAKSSQEKDALTMPRTSLLYRVKSREKKMTNPKDNVQILTAGSIGRY